MFGSNQQQVKRLTTFSLNTKKEYRIVRMQKLKSFETSAPHKASEKVGFRKYPAVLTSIQLNPIDYHIGEAFSDNEDEVVVNIHWFLRQETSVQTSI